MHPDVALAIIGVFFFIGIVLVFIAIVYFIGKKMLESHIEREQLEDREKRFDVGYKELLTTSLVFGIIAGIFSGYFGIGLFYFVWAVVVGGGAVFLLKSSTSIKGKLHIRKAVLVGGFTGVITGLVSFLIEYFFGGTPFERTHLAFVVTFITTLFVLGALGAAIVNK